MYVFGMTIAATKFHIYNLGLYTQRYVGLNLKHCTGQVLILSPSTKCVYTSITCKVTEYRSLFIFKVNVSKSVQIDSKYNIT